MLMTETGSGAKVSRILCWKNEYASFGWPTKTELPNFHTHNPMENESPSPMDFLMVIFRHNLSFWAGSSHLDQAAWTAEKEGKSFRGNVICLRVAVRCISSLQG